MYTSRAPFAYFQSAMCVDIDAGPVIELSWSVCVRAVCEIRMKKEEENEENE